jgi:hypothetical protein
MPSAWFRLAGRDTAPPSLRVWEGPFPRFVATMRYSDSHPSLSPHFVASLGDTTLASCLLPATRRRVVGRGVGIPVPEPEMSVETDGALRFPSNPRVPAPCPWTPVGPDTPGHCGVPTWPPLVSTTEAPAMNISGLESTALRLAVYASQ